MFASNEIKKRGKHTCMVTLDQPLFIKATDIVFASNELNNVVVKLVGFHLLMSFLGTIGFIMAGSGLEELWSTVYAKALVVQMLTGHNYARAMRAHFMTQQALVVLLFEHDTDLDEQQNC